MYSEYLDHIMSQSSKNELMGDLSRLNPTPRRIEIHHKEKYRQNSQSIFHRLKVSWLGKYCVRAIKRYTFVRQAAFWLWRGLPAAYCNLKDLAVHLLGGRARRWLLLSRLYDFTNKRDIPKIKLADAELVVTPAPEAYPTCDRGYLTSPHEHYIFPEVFVAEISNGMVYGGTNIILAEDMMICHDLFDVEHDYTSEELHGRALINSRTRRMRWILHDRAQEKIPVAASFVDAVAPNYAHWITEVLPRIALFCADRQFKDVPIVINDNLHENIMESLFLVAGQEREYITLPIGRALQVESLYLTSVAGYVPFDRRNTKLPGHSHGVFSPRAFKLINDKVKFFLEKLPMQDCPEKIYIRRNSGLRKVTNAKELEEFLVRQGYVIVEPEKLTFLQQAQLFSKAKSIVASSGAALANMIFASGSANIIIIIGKFSLTSYWYWQNIACASGKKISYVFGEAVDVKINGIHADFTIDLDNFVQVLGGRRWRWLTKLSEFVKKKDIPKIKLADAELVETPVPEAYPTSDRGYLTSPHEHYIFPEVFVAEISNGMVYGGTNLILAEDEVICHDLYDFEHDYTSEELHGCTLIDPKTRRIRWLMHDRAPERIPVAASFVDAVAPNYAHWITEVLPRIALFCADRQFKDVPIVINDNLHENIMESLFLVAGQEREIITLPIGRALQVESLYLTSVAGYVPFELRNTKLPGHSHGVFSPRAFKLINDKVKFFLEKLPMQDCPKKIYIRRNSGSRNVTNAKKFEELLVSQGYVIVEPEKLTFLQQAQLFSKAKSIVASSGAALANMIFASGSANIIIIIGKFSLTSYWYWQNIACASGKKISYVFGEAVDVKTKGVHADFTIDLDNFVQVVGGKR